MFQKGKIIRVTFFSLSLYTEKFCFPFSKERKSIRGRKENKVGHIQIEYKRILEESFTTVLFVKSLIYNWICGIFRLSEMSSIGVDRLRSRFPVENNQWNYFTGNYNLIRLN